MIDKFTVGTTTATADSTGNLSITTGTLVANIEGVTGNNADTATALATGRTIGMTGDVVWTSASFDGSGNVTGTAVIQPNTISSTELVSASTLLIKDSSGSTLKTVIESDHKSYKYKKENINYANSNNNKQIQSTQRRTVQRKFW